MNTQIPKKIYSIQRATQKLRFALFRNIVFWNQYSIPLQAL